MQKLKSNTTRDWRLWSHWFPLGRRLKRFIDSPSRRENEAMLSITNYLSENKIVFLKKNTRDEVISELVDRLDEEGDLLDKEAFHQAILEREKIVSTGIGMDFFMALGIHRQGIDWQSLDGSPVHLVFIIGGSNTQQTHYLQLLSRLTSAIKEESLRKDLVKEHSKQNILNLFKRVG